MSVIGFSTDATQLAGYATRANERLGSFQLLVQNTGSNSLYLRIKEYDGVTSPSGWFDVAGPYTIVAAGSYPVNVNTLSQKVGFFGSGNTTANIQINYNNPSDLRGAQIDLVATGRKGWGFDDGFNTNAFTAKLGKAPDGTTTDKAPGE